MKASVNPIRRERLHDQITRQIALGILSGTIGLGERGLSTETDLCRLFKVSRTALRESVKVLAAKGILEVRPKTGMRVRPRSEWNLVDPDLLAWQCEAGVDKDLVRNLIELCSIVEPRAAEFAAARATGEEITELERLCHEMRTHAEDAEALLETNKALHARMFNACHNEFLARLCRTIREALLGTQQICTRLRTALPEFLPAYEEVLHAIQQHDGPAARIAMERLFEQCTNHILRPERTVNSEGT